MERPGWRDLLAGTNAARSLVLAGGVGLHAVNIFVVTTILPSVVADIGGLAFYAWNTTLFVVASIIGSALSAHTLGRLGPRDAYLLSAASSTVSRTYTNEALGHEPDGPRRGLVRGRLGAYRRKQPLVLGGNPRRRELAHTLDAASPELGRQLGIGHQPDDGCAQRGHVSRRHRQRRVPHDLGTAGRSGRHDRAAMRHRLQQDHREILLDRREGENRAVA